MEERKKISHANGNQKEEGWYIFILEKLDFKSKIVTRDHEGDYIMIKYQFNRMIKKL